MGKRRLFDWCAILSNFIRRRDVKNVALLFVNVRRHSEWYAPEFKTFRDIPSPRDLPEILESATAAYTDDANVPLPAGWRRVPVVTFRRSIIIHAKHHILSLFLIERNP